MYKSLQQVGDSLQVLEVFSPLKAGVIHDNQPTSFPHHRLIEASAVMFQTATTSRFEPWSTGASTTKHPPLCAPVSQRLGTATDGSEFESWSCHQQHYDSGFNQPMWGIDVGWFSCVTPAFSGLNTCKGLAVKSSFERKILSKELFCRMKPNGRPYNDPFGRIILPKHSAEWKQ